MLSLYRTHMGFDLLFINKQNVGFLGTFNSVLKPFHNNFAFNNTLSKLKLIG